MSGAASPHWLDRAYGAALVVHAGVILALVWLAVVAARGVGEGANAAREGFGLMALMVLPGILPAVPSGIALMSWGLCKRRGWTLSKTHMGLSVAAAVVLFILILVVFVS